MRNWEMRAQQFPIITVGIVVLNREWIIDRMLGSLLRQDYPHDSIFVVLVDGGSEDRTVETASKTLENSDFLAYDITVKRCSIPEGRNICIERMKGDLLVYWDSDIVAQPFALRELVTIVVERKADVAHGQVVVFSIDSPEELDEKVTGALAEKRPLNEEHVVEAPSVGMGFTAIPRDVLSQVQFDPDMTFAEDVDFSLRAREKGFKLILDKRLRVYDVNLTTSHYSDIYVGMPLKAYLRGLRKKAKASVLGLSLSITFHDTVKPLLRSSRVVFHLGYIPVVIITIYGVFSDNLLCLTFPLYLTMSASRQVMKRGSEGDWKRRSEASCSESPCTR